MASFLKKVGKPTDRCALSLCEAGGKGGWIKNLSDLRDQVIHVAPVAQSQEFSFCRIRPKDLNGVTLPTLHFPLANQDGSIRRTPVVVPDISDASQVQETLDAYRDFSSNSRDALEMCWTLAGNLVDLSEQIRADAGLAAPIPTITAKHLRELEP